MTAEAAREAARKNDGKFGEQVHGEPAVTLEAKQAVDPQWNDAAKQYTDAGVPESKARAMIAAFVVKDFASAISNAVHQASPANETGAALHLIAQQPIVGCVEDLVDAAKAEDLEAARDAVRKADRSLAASDSLLGVAFRGESIFSKSRRALAEVSAFLDQD